MLDYNFKIFLNDGWAPVAHVCNPSYLEGLDWEDGSLG
jgi:hypothetical protein